MANSMNFDLIKKKFEERIEKKYMYYFSNWIEGALLTEEYKLYLLWLNQLSEEEVCKYLKEDPTILSVISNQTDKMCETAIKKIPFSIKYLKNQTVDLCILALQTELVSDQSFHFVYKYIKIVPNPDHETTLKNLKNKKEILDALK